MRNLWIRRLTATAGLFAAAWLAAAPTGSAADDTLPPDVAKGLVARDIAYPHVDVPRPVAPIPVEPLEPLVPLPPGRAPLWYELWPSDAALNAEAEPAPWWIGWLLAACLLSIATATWLILSTV